MSILDHFCKFLKILVIIKAFKTTIYNYKHERFMFGRFGSFIDLILFDTLTITKLAENLQNWSIYKDQQTER